MSLFTTRKRTFCLTLSLALLLATGPVWSETESGGQPPKLLKGTITESTSPIIPGEVQSLPKGTKVALTMMCNLNSEVSQTGDEIRARVSVDVGDGRKVLLPGGWYVHGKVTDSATQRRLGRDGYVEVEFDKLVSPDGEINLPFHTKFSTRDNELKAISKIVAKDTGYMTEGAIGGAILSTQLTGIPVAIMTHGLSLAVGAAAGAGLGAVGSLARKGKIASIYPGDEVKLSLPEQIELPGFDPALLPSATQHLKTANLDLAITDCRWGKDPFGDSQTKLVTMKVKIANQTKQEVSFFNLVVESESGQRYFPSLLSRKQIINKDVNPMTSAESTVSFSVAKSKHKYFLVLLDRGGSEELTRAEIN